MKTVFISNYINHHQIPFSDALYERLGSDYTFIQTEPMEEERVKMGWGLDPEKIPYVRFSDREEGECRRRIEEADLVLAGWTRRTDLFLPRLSSDRLTFRISERIYREGQWKAVSPRGLAAKYREHVKFRNRPVWLLCAGAYVASDFSLIGAYPGKKLKFGYFPKLRLYEEDRLFAGKRGDVIQMIWAGRMIPLKHPEYVVRLAKELDDMGMRFLIHFVGSGPMEGELKAEIARMGLASRFCLYGFLKPDEVRDLMERCSIHLFTSNYLEGWGTVVNEAMNSGCCTVANARAGAVPFLVRDGENGLTWEDGSYEGFARKVKEAVKDPEAVERMGRAAWRTIAEEWNAQRAAEACLEFYEGWKAGCPAAFASGPLSRAPVLSARWKYDEGKLEG
mgnify:FL=1